MNILFCIKALNNVKGGAERVLTDIANGLEKRGHNVTVLTFDQKGGQSFYPLSKNIKRIDLGLGDVTKRTNIREAFERIILLRKTISTENPDIVLGFMHSMFVPLSFAMIGKRMPIIASEHIVPQHYKTRPLEFIFLILSGFFVHRITVLSDRVKQTYPAIMRKKMIAIANPVHVPKVFAEVKGEDGAQKIILNVGRLDPQKDQKTLIKAFAMLANAYPDWNLNIIGEGPLRFELEKLIQGLGLGDRVSLLGSIKDISVVYQKAHIFAMSSLYESFGLATAEAMAHGLPAVGYADCPGTNELIVDGKTGFLVSGSDWILALKEGLELLILDPDLRVSFGNKGKKEIEKFSYDSILDAWEGLLLSSLNKVT